MYYSNRSWKHQNFVFIQPFVDVEGDLPIVELFLDTNAFIRLLHDISFLDGLKRIPGIQGYFLNPSIALAEQWLSNPKFRENANETDPMLRGKMIKIFVAQAAKGGLAFDNGYVDKMIAACRREEDNLRYMAGTLFAYIAAIRSLQRRKMDTEERIERFVGVLRREVPRFSGLIALAALTFASLKHRRLCGRDGRAIVAFVDSFFSPKGSEPDYLTLGYLRNRAMDLLCWYWMPYFSRGYLRNSDVAPIVVTGDKFLAAVPFRFIPPLRPQSPSGPLALGLFKDDMNPSDAQLYLDIFNRLHVPTNDLVIDQDRKQELVANLYDGVRGMLHAEDLKGFDQGRMWIFPGTVLNPDC
ncbi:hypothetical protein [Rhizobium leguminosarum]|uniref:Uncharacterized protein n=1 Tax=Rhizobium leguminosarum TaxID=384 RepID=A0A7K3VNT4_RHILE|nr:hypothetical protein [Rhizobium leguminosarum]NEK18148.1 hypothetical protein [Rhizobium leguminosarum]